MHLAGLDGLYFPLGGGSSCATTLLRRGCGHHRYGYIVFHIPCEACGGGFEVALRWRSLLSKVQAPPKLPSVMNVNLYVCIIASLTFPRIHCRRSRWRLHLLGRPCHALESHTFPEVSVPQCSCIDVLSYVLLPAHLWVWCSNISFKLLLACSGMHRLEAYFKMLGKRVRTVLSLRSRHMSLRMTMLRHCLTRLARYGKR